VHAVVFDMDGVIFDTEPLYFSAEDEMLRRRGHRFTADLAQHIMGMPGLVAMEFLRRELGLADSAEELFAEAQTGFRHRLEDGLTFIPGFDLVLNVVSEARLPKAVATSTHRELALYMLDRFDLPARFDAILTRDDVAHGKPHPEIFELACRRLRANPENTLVLEDSVNGVRAAQAAGCLTVAVRHGHNRHLSFPGVLFESELLLDSRLVKLIK
jgi:HAD superfamily hydrolase (TIGR01509 family)